MNCDVIRSNFERKLPMNVINRFMNYVTFLFYMF